MANALPQVIAQLAPGATTLTILYDCPPQTSAYAYSLIVCNRSAVAATFRVAVCPAAAAINDKHYLYYDLPIAANDTFMASIGVSLLAGDMLRVYASTANLSFNLLGDITYPVTSQ